MSDRDEFGVAESQWTEVVVPNDLRSAKRPEDAIMRALARCRYDPDTTFAIKLAFEEAITNAVKHGNRSDGSKRIVVRFHVTRERSVIVVRDEGGGFRPATVPDPTADENLERPNGRGIMLIHAYMSKVRFNQSGNEVWMLKERPAGSRPVRGSRSTLR